MTRRRAELDDGELEEMPAELRWREYMGRVEAVLFAAPGPVTRDALAHVVGDDVRIEALIDDIREELRASPYEIVFVAGGWQFQSRAKFAPYIRAAAGAPVSAPLSENQARVLTAIASFQPVTRAELCQIVCRDVSRDVLAALRETGLAGTGPRSPRAGAPVTYVTTGKILERCGFASPRDMPDMEKLEDEGLLSKEAVFSGERAAAFGIEIDDPDEADEDVASEFVGHQARGEED
jgi:segregation and condensation protein B